MRVRYWLYTAAALCGLVLAGCGGEPVKPPADANADTPVIDIDEGIETSPDEIAPKTADDTQPAEPAK